MEEQHDLAKWLEGRMTGSELEAFEKSPEFSIYNKIKDQTSLIKAPDFDADELYRKTTSGIKNKPVVKLQSNWVVRIAAILILAMGLFFIWRPISTTKEFAENGTKTTFQLPDNSEVTLNSGSEISYGKWSWDSKRELHLNGEAFFKVTKGKTFDVNTDLGKVTVVGTQFNVKSRGNRFEVICFEGKVKVQNASEKVFLVKGESVTFENGKRINSIAETAEIPSWMRNQISFNAEQFSDVIAEIQRQYNITINTENTTSNQKFTGTIPSDKLDIALEIISASFHLNYTKATPKEVTFSQK
ncbi:MAG TPA: FecR domain-containing protein [Flavobacterium sp.]|nr:FecR domain-containing protein [Flavobacterium sp.]